MRMISTQIRWQDLILIPRAVVSWSRGYKLSRVALGTRMARPLLIALQVVRTSFEFHLRECMGSSFPRLV